MLLTVITFHYIWVFLPKIFEKIFQILYPVQLLTKLQWQEYLIWEQIILLQSQ